jgi:monoamine oxidase
VEETAVVVVGAGMAGLVAARELHRQGIDVLVLEAADRLGGRAMSGTTSLGSRVDLGGQWIGHDHTRFIALAKELGATQFKMHTGLMPVLVDGPKRLPVSTVLEALLLLAGVEAMAVIGTPRRWDTSTVEAWLRKVPGRRARRLLEVLAWISWTADLDRFSIRAMAKMIRLQGGLRTAMSTKGGAQDSLLVEGVASLIDGLADELGPRVRRGQRVASIVCSDTGVTIRTSAGDISAAKVIVTAPPPMAAHISYEPPLPRDTADMQRRCYMGSVYKAIGVYEQPFWRARKGGEFIVLDNPGRAVFDTTPPGGPGHLCILVAGPEARDLDRLDPIDRRHAVLGSLAQHIGPEVLQPVDWHEKAWHRDEYAGGGYMAVPDPGSGLSLPVPSAPIGGIHWAGSETAGDHPGYLEGAIESGHRAAQEVIRALPSIGAA